MKETPIKIALVGTSCVGKTRVLEHFRNLYQGNEDVAFVDEAARDYFERNTVADPFSYRTQRKIQDLVLKKEQQAEESNPKAMVTDRSVMCAPVYVSAMEDFNGAEKLWERVSKWVLGYDHILLFDPDGLPFVRDGIRQEDAELRIKFHQEYLAFFQQTQLPYMLLWGSLERRARIAGNIIKQALDGSFNPVDPTELGEEDLEEYLTGKGQIRHPNGQIASEILYKGHKRLEAFVREGRLGIGSIIRVSDYGRLIDPHFDLTSQGLISHDEGNKVYTPKEALNLEAAPWGWSIVG